MIDFKINNGTIYLSFIDICDFFTAEIKDLLKTVGSRLFDLYAHEKFVESVEICGETVEEFSKKLANILDITEVTIKKYKTRIDDSFYGNFKSISLSVAFLNCNCKLLPLTAILRLLETDNNMIASKSVLLYDCKITCVESAASGYIFNIRDCVIETFLLIDYMVCMKLENTVIGLLETPVSLAKSKKVNPKTYTNCSVDFGNIGRFKVSEESPRSRFCQIILKKSDTVVGLLGTDLYRRIALDDTKRQTVFYGNKCTLRLHDVGTLPKGYCVSREMLMVCEQKIDVVRLYYGKKKIYDCPYAFPTTSNKVRSW